ncbi:MAG: hypothetical protein QOD63_3076 [Actinomycetota bacterium]|nr:hypothetical protein [Actinomycetota bacterium]
MSRIAYEDWKPGAEALGVLVQATTICADYQQQGYDLTLRQLYYQFVARGLIPNTQKSYKRLGDIVNRGRLAGLLDWNFIVDRTRNLMARPHWSTPADIISSSAAQFRIDKWAEQPVRVEVWVEKEALAGVIGQAGNREDCAYFACRGYVSQSELWGAAQRLGRYVEAGQRVVVLHLGDHDPSGIDMTRDIEDRLLKFTTVDYVRAHRGDFAGKTTMGDVEKAMTKKAGGTWPSRPALEVKRIALNMDQVEEYDPPPNPAKLTDSRIAGYLERFGDESWELDALDPATLDDLITAEIDAVRDADAWQDLVEEEDEHRRLLRSAATRWPELVDLLGRAG